MMFFRKLFGQVLDISDRSSVLKQVGKELRASPVDIGLRLQDATWPDWLQLGDKLYGPGSPTKGTGLNYIQWYEWKFTANDGSVIRLSTLY